MKIIVILEFWFTRAISTIEIPVSAASYLQIERFMKMRMQKALLVLFVLMISSCSKEPLEDTVAIELENAVVVENQLLEIVNSYRTANNFTNLKFSAVAYSYANQHTDYMIAKGSLSHDNFSARASGIAAEINVLEVAENVAKNYNNATEAFENWLQSNDHRKAIEGNFSHTAVSVKKDKNGNYYFTQLFFKAAVELP